MSKTPEQADKLREFVMALRHGSWSDGVGGYHCTLHLPCGHTVEGTKLPEYCPRCGAVVRDGDRGGVTDEYNDRMRHKVVEMLDEMAALKAENANLRMAYEMTLRDMVKRHGRLYDENDKLRELVKALWHLLHDWLFKSGEVPYNEMDAAYESMRELGIEAD